MENALKTQVQNEALRIMLPLDRSGAAISMGVGKTRLGIRHMLNQRHSRMFTKFLVVYPSTPIKNSWIDEIKLMGYPDLLDQITFVTYRSLHKITEHYDVIYLDECHSLKDSHAPALRAHKGQIVGLTGTKPRFAVSEKGQLVNEFCPIVYTYMTNEAVDEAILNDYKIFIHRIPLSTEKNLRMESKNGGVWYTSEQENYDYWEEALQDADPAEEQKLRILRMQAMKKYMSKEHYYQEIKRFNIGKTLIFANNKAQADRMCEHVYYTGNKTNKQNLEDFKSGKIMEMACINQLSQGINIPDLNYGVIMHAYGNERSAAQRFGRMLRLPSYRTSYTHLLVYKDTVDEVWASRALEDFDQTKIFDFDLQETLCYEM